MADSYTITFAKNSGDGTSASTSTACSTIVSAGSDYLSGNLATATKVYYSGGSGLKLGASSNAGTIKMNLSTAGQVTPTSIVVNAKLYSSSKATTLKVNGSATQNLAADFADYTFAITSKITYIELVTSKYAWISSITVNYEGDTPSGPTLESIYFTEDAATKLSYTEGDVFDPTGLVVMGKYSEGEDKPVTDKVEWSFDPETLAATTTSVTITASIDDVEDAQKTVNGITVASAPKFTKVTANKTDWSGEYLLVYENNSTAYVWTGVDVANGNVSATINNNQIAKPATAATLTIAKMTDGYSIQVNGGNSGDNNGKYISGKSGSNTVNFETTASANTLAYSNGNVTITSNTSTIMYNSSSSDNRFRYYKSGSSQKAVQLYEKVLAPTNEAVTFAAPEGGSLVIKNGETTITTGTTIQNGTVLDVEFEMTPAEAYKDVAIKVTKTVGGDDVTSTVYNSETKKITMPRYAITVAVTSTKLYKIEAATVTGGSFSWEDENKAKPTYVEVGTLIQALAEEATHYEFKSFDIYKTGDATAKVTNEEGLFEMPAYDVTISGTFEEMQCTALPSAPVLGTPTISYADGVTLNWTKLDDASGYVINVWKGSEKILDDEVIEGVDIVSYKIGEEMEVNTTYNYSIAGLGDDVTYCMTGNPSSESSFTTADYPAATLTLSENGVETPYSGSIKINTPFNLPNCSVECDKVFVGWSTSNMDYSNLLAAGSSYTMTETTGILYAWFATETPGTTTWNKVNTVSVGEYVIINNSKYLPNTTTSSAPAQAGAPTITDNKIADADVTAAMKWILSDAGNGKFYVKNSGGDYLYETDNNNGLRVGNTSDTWAFETNDGALAMKGSNKNRYCATYKDGSDWRSYTTANAGNYGDGGKLYLYKKQAGASSYSDYSLTCSAKANAPEFSLEEGTFTSAQTLTITAEQGATIYYTLDDTEPTISSLEYKGAISLNTYGQVTIKAMAVVTDKKPSDVTSAEYMMDLPFTSLQQLAETEVSSGSTITISFPKTQIKSLAGTKGVYFNIQKEDKDIEIYCNSTDFSNTWEAGGYLSATNLTCKWTRYVKNNVFQCWELTPSDWSAFEYSDPDPFTSVADLYAAGLTDGSKVYLNITNAYVHAKTVTSPNNFVYVQDGGVGIVLRTSEFADDNIGKLMTAKIVGNLSYSNGRPQIAVTSMSEVSYTAGDRPAADVTTLSASEEASQILSLVKIDGYYAQSQDKQAKTAVITENANGTGASYTIYNLFGALKTVPESSKAINVKGLFYKKVESNVTSYSIVPVLVEDVALVTPADAPAASVDKGSEDSGNPTEVGNGEIITITPAAGFTASYILNDAAEKTITASEEKVTMTANSTLIIKSSRDYYTTTSKTYYYKINEALTYHSITKPIGNYTCELSAASAKQNDEVTITFAMNDHWYLDGVTVKNAADKTVEFAATKVSDTEYRFAMPAYDVTLSTATHSDPTYSIDYQTGGKYTTGGTKPTEGSKYEGDEVTLQPNTWTVNDFVFDKWKVIYETGDAEPKEQHEVEVVNGKFRMPPYNVKVIAQWVAFTRSKCIRKPRR